MRRPSAYIGAVSIAAMLPTMAVADSGASCTAGASPVTFGNYIPTSTLDTTSAGAVTVSCSILGLLSLLVSYNITLSTGSGSYAQRTLASGANKLAYNLYTDAGMTSVWGDNTAGTVAPADGYLLGLGTTVRSYPVYGKIPALQTNAAPGTYADSIIVTVTY